MKTVQKTKALNIQETSIEMSIETERETIAAHLIALRVACSFKMYIFCFGITRYLLSGVILPRAGLNE